MSLRAISPIRTRRAAASAPCACAPATDIISRSRMRPRPRISLRMRRPASASARRQKPCCFRYRTSGGDITQATSLSGQPYTGLPNALKYRTEFNPSCSCRKPGQSWADALGKDEAVAAGDVVVTEERAKQLSAAAGPKSPNQRQATRGCSAGGDHSRACCECSRSGRYARCDREHAEQGNDPCGRLRHSSRRRHLKNRTPRSSPFRARSPSGPAWATACRGRGSC